MVDYLNELIVDLLHIDEGNENKLINLKAGGGASTFVLSNSKAKSLGEDTFELIKKRIGKVGNTILNESSLVPSNEQKIGNKLNMYDWIELNGEKDPKRNLHSRLPDFLPQAKPLPSRHIRQYFRCIPSPFA